MFNPYTYQQLTSVDRHKLDSLGYANLEKDKIDPVNPYGKDIKATEISMKRAERRLEVKFNDGSHFRYPAEFLRVESPSAEVQGHGGVDQKRIVYGKRNVGFKNLEPVGNYAIRIIFDDAHDSGIYSWRYLHEIGTKKFSLMRKYILDLRARNLSRDRGKSGRNLRKAANEAAAAAAAAAKAEGETVAASGDAQQQQQSESSSSSSSNFSS